MVMRKISNFWHVKSKSLKSTKCSLLYFFGVVCFFNLWDRLWLTTVCIKLHFIILSYDSFSQDGCLQTNEMALNWSEQKLPSFQKITHYLLHNSKPVPFLGVLQWIKIALKDILRDTWKTAWPSVLDDAEEITACKYKVTLDNFQVDF